MATSSGKKERKKTTKIVVDNELLIEEIRKHPFIFDTSHVDYKDTGKKDNRWDAIADKFGITRKQAMDKWKGLRDSFMKLKRKKNEECRSGAGAEMSRPPKWKYFTLMESVLAHTLHYRESITNCSLDNDLPSTEDFINGKVVDDLLKSIGEPIYLDNPEDHPPEDSILIVTTMNGQEEETSKDPKESEPTASTKIMETVLSTKGMENIMPSTTEAEIISISKAAENTKPSRPGKRKVDTELSSLLSLAKENISKLTTTATSDAPPQKEESDLYFASMAERFRKLPTKKQRRVRYQIETAFFEAEEEE